MSTDTITQSPPRTSHARTGILAHDAEWQFPAITEQHSYERAKEHLFDVDGVVYLAFPWATLLDRYNTKRSAATPLFNTLKALVDQIAPGVRVVTVCQHIHMMKFIDVFFDHRVTDIFWTHAVKGQTSVSADREIALYPFPLYPVQFPKKEDVPVAQDRAHLFSFIGARANQWYLTESRNWILDILGGDERGLVVGRDSWHFNKIVYDYQIRKTSATQDKLISQDATEQFKQTLRETTFALCPSGSGPNSIRLWEAIGAGSIPVILADTYLPPGRQALWREGAVFCDETPEAIKALPARLEAIANDPEQLAHKRQMLNQLWMLYGTETFVTDIQHLYLDIANQGAEGDAGSDRTARPAGLADLAEKLQRRGTPSHAQLSMYLNACISRVMIDPRQFGETYAQNPSVAELIDQAIQRNVNAKAIERYRRALDFAQLEALPAATPSRPAAQRSLDKPIKVHLWGKHANRTPLSYAVYDPHLKDRVELMPTPDGADIVMTGFNIDFQQDTKTLREQKLDNHALKHVVLSEEPLWDTVWSGDYNAQKQEIESRLGNIPYHFYNHVNSDIYAFDKIPYFITTEDSFFVRYGNLARRNARLSAQDWLDQWASASIRAAFYAEIRENPKYKFKDEENDIHGLCMYRTAVAKYAKRGTIKRVGKGWPKTAKKRQALPDWHLDKLAALDGRTLIASGLENTHQRDYITEKIFDAFAVGAVPVYFASSDHRIHEIFPDGGFLNAFGMSDKEAGAMIDGFEPDLAFAERYRKSQQRMAELFSDPAVLRAERAALVGRFMDEAQKLISI